MHARYQIADGRLTFDLEGDTKEIFKQLSSIQEVFEAESECGMCRGTNIAIHARKVDDFEFYELLCRKCSARFAFGQAKKGGALFPKRKDEDGNWLDHGGWSKWQPQGEAPPVPPPAPPPQRAPAPTASPTAVDAKTQERFNKLAGAWGVAKAPVRYADFLDMCRAHFESLTAPNTAGAQAFDKLHRKYMFEHKDDYLHANNIHAFMTEIWKESQVLTEAGVPY